MLSQARVNSLTMLNTKTIKSNHSPKGRNPTHKHIMKINEIQATNYKALKANMLKAVRNTDATKDELEMVYVKFDNKMEVFHLNGLISDNHLGKLDSLLFDITENVLYSN
mgnify:FL=1